MPAIDTWTICLLLGGRNNIINKNQFLSESYFLPNPKKVFYHHHDQFVKARECRSARNTPKILIVRSSGDDQ